MKYLNPCVVLYASVCNFDQGVSTRIETPWKKDGSQQRLKIDRQSQHAGAVDAEAGAGANFGRGGLIAAGDFLIGS